MIAFDLDGCLIDSEDLIRAAYRDAGVEPPPGFMTLGHHRWIPGDAAWRARVHARKDTAYLCRLAAAPMTVLPPWAAAERLHAAGVRTALLTGAPAGTLAVLRAVVRSWPFTASEDGAGPGEKTAWLAGLAPSGVYVDDQQYVTVPAGWRFVHYTGQDAAELIGQVT